MAALGLYEIGGPLMKWRCAQAPQRNPAAELP